MRILNKNKVGKILYMRILNKYMVGRKNIMYDNSQ